MKKKGLFKYLTINFVGNIICDDGMFYKLFMKIVKIES